MATTRIVTDSAADLAPQMARELEITVIPLNVRFGEQTYDDVTLSHDAFWELAGAGLHPSTSQPAPGVYIEAFRRLVEAGHEVVCTTVTGKHSGTYNSAWSAAQAFDGLVRVVDSASLSLGQGWQAIQAARLALDGLTAERIVQAIESIRERTSLLILLDTLENLRRGGRAARLMPAIDRLAKALSLKPIISVIEGELKLHAVARSTSKGIRRMQEEIAALGPLEFLAVMHIRCREAAEQVADELAHRLAMPRERIWLAEAGAVLASHGGRGTLGVVGVLAR
jgi:DegV family protein with EDD domain